MNRFLDDLQPRASLLVLSVICAIASAAYGGFLAELWARGYPELAVIGVVVWLVAAWPWLVLFGFTVVDCFLYAVDGKTIVIPSVFEAANRKAENKQGESQAQPTLSTLIYRFTYFANPLTPLSMILILVLRQLPANTAAVQRILRRNERSRRLAELEENWKGSSDPFGYAF